MKCQVLFPKIAQRVVNTSSKTLQRQVNGIRRGFFCQVLTKDEWNVCCKTVICINLPFCLSVSKLDCSVFELGCSVYKKGCWDKNHGLNDEQFRSL